MSESYCFGSSNNCGTTIIKTVSQHHQTPSRTNSVWIGQGQTSVFPINNPEGMITAFIPACTFILTTGAQTTDNQA